jgi:hypothetical protein
MLRRDLRQATAPGSSDDIQELFPLASSTYQGGPHPPETIAIFRKVNLRDAIAYPGGYTARRYTNEVDWRVIAQLVKPGS